ncbi:MAG: MFS transporter [Candidatus Sumerlaeota bacterium]|nr:MFS transporter [Candidatus Sumerlaeota bacterium]
MSSKKQGSGYWPIMLNLSFMLLFFAQVVSFLGDRLDQFTLLELARVHSYLFSARDIKDPQRLALLLSDRKNPVSQDILERHISKEGARLLESYDSAMLPPPALSLAMREALNHAIKSADFYDAKRFANVALTTQCQKLLLQKQESLKVADLNRRLLEVAYPGMFTPRDPSTDNSDLIMTLIALFMHIPFILLAPLVGPIVDRFSRKTVLIVASFFQGVIICSIPFLRDAPFVQENAVAMIYLVMFLVSVFTAFFIPAKQALVAELVPGPYLMAANSLTTFAGTIMNSLGAFVAAEMLRQYGHNLNICFYIDTATYVIAIVLFALIAIPNTPEIQALRRQQREGKESFFREISEALKYVRRHARPFKLIALSASFAAIAGGIYSLINAKVLGQMRASTETYGLYQGILGLALIAGGLLMTIYHRRVKAYESFASKLFILVAISAVWIAAAGDLRIHNVSESAAAAAQRIYLRVFEGTLAISWSIVPTIIIGMCGGALMVFIATLIQRSVPKRYHGRIFALDNMLYFLMLITAFGVSALGQKMIKQDRMTLIHFGMCVGALALAVSFGIVCSTEWLRYKWIRRMGLPLLRMYCRLEIEGEENIPRRGALIVAANHSSWIDTVLIGAAVPRVVHYLTTTDLYNYWLFRPFMKLFGAVAFPEGRGARSGINAGLDILERHRIFGIFPEGGLSNDGKLGPAKGGIGLIASKSGAPILPIALVGAFDVLPRHGRFPRPAKVRIRIGKPIDPRGKDREQITQEVMEAIADLMNAPKR